jgi:membrane protease YdiL (CAAX protease family)
VVDAGRPGNEKGQHSHVKVLAMAERQGFEPWEAFTSLVFKTNAFGRSAISPHGATYRTAFRAAETVVIRQISAMSTTVCAGRRAVAPACTLFAAATPPEYPRRMRKSKFVQLAIGGVIGLVLGGLLVAKDEIGFWLYGLPIALVLVLNGPLTGRRFVKAVRERLREEPHALVSIYWQLVFSTLMMAGGAALFLWAYGFESGDYGLSWHLGDPGPLAVVMAIACTATSVGLVMRRNHRNETLQESVEVLLPDTRAEKWGWTAISFSAGIGEEIAYRGFLTVYFYYLDPSIPLWFALTLSTIAFGLAHTYQGLRGVLTTTVLGAVLAYLYWDTESLLLPMIVHTAVDLAILLRKKSTATDAELRGDSEASSAI